MPKITHISSKKLRKFFEKQGFTCVRIAGDHYVYTKDWSIAENKGKTIEGPEIKMTPLYAKILKSFHN